MTASILSRTAQKVTISIDIDLSKPMLESEKAIQRALNEGGILATKELLEHFDTDGCPLRIGGVKYTSKKVKEPKTYQTPYGEVVVDRYIYQTSQGGSTFCPLEKNARIIGTSTPRFAMIISHKYTSFGAAEVVNDLQISNERSVSRSFVKNITDIIGMFADSKEESWSYELMDIPEDKVQTVTVGLDGTTIRMVDGSYRMAMVGTCGLYDKDGERLFTSYVGASPEYGKEKFLDRLQYEVDQIKSRYSSSHFLGLADGAKDNWPFLEKNTDSQMLDFYHATGYLTGVADCIYPGKKNKAQRQQWLDTICHNLKHNPDAASDILDDIKKIDQHEMSIDQQEIITGAITYFKNNLHRMNYYKNVEENKPIGSGITEAACKTIVKQRLCKSGMKWKEEGASNVIVLRCLSPTQGKWEQFWNNISKYGFNLDS